MAHAADKSSTKKPKLVRDSFTIPKNEYAAIDALKARAIALGTSVKKSELLRAGLMALQGLSDAAYKAALSAVPTLKTGRPASDETDKPAPAKPVRKESPARSTVPKASAARTAPSAPSPSAAPAKAVSKPAARKPATKRPAAAARKTTARKTARKTASKTAR
jgi:hypothetical protein